MTENCERSSVAREGEVAEYVPETETSVQAPRAVVLVLHFRSGQQHAAFRAAPKESARECATESVSLCMWGHVQLGQFEIVREDRVDVLVIGAGSTQTVPDLLVPPLMPSTLVPVRDGDQWGVGRGQDCTDSAPSGSEDVLGPHRGAVILRALRVTHCLDVDRQRFGKATTEFSGGQIDQVRGRFRVGSDCSQPFLDDLSVGTAILNMSNGCSMSVIRR